jgi:uncharacterized protein YprB with RNaseH-like and TPR domain
MLRNTFVHVAGIGDRTEQYLWTLGVVDWDRALGGLSGRVPARCRKCLPAAMEESQQALARGDACFFAERLAARHHWRLYSSFSGRTAFLDIETTGLGAGSVITTIAVYDGQAIRTYVRDQNLHEFPADIRGYQLLVTYNGRTFDVPFLEREFAGLRLRQPHVDLRYLLASLGYRGGLKGCEQKLGIGRPEALQDVDGFMAVRLWWAHERGDPRALPALLRYNIEDTLNLRWLMETAYNMAVERLPVALPVKQVPVAHRPRIDWPFDAGIIQELAGPRPFESHWSTHRRG